MGLRVATSAPDGWLRCSKVEKGIQKYHCMICGYPVVNGHLNDAVVYDFCSFTECNNLRFSTLRLQPLCCVCAYVLTCLLTPSRSGGTCTGQPPSNWTENLYSLHLARFSVIGGWGLERGLVGSTFLTARSWIGNMEVGQYRICLQVVTWMYLGSYSVDVKGKDHVKMQHSCLDIYREAPMTFLYSLRADSFLQNLSWDYWAWAMGTGISKIVC